jgi:hypothetical protein
MSFKVVVRVTGESKFCGNGLRFATEQEAKTYGNDLSSRWFAVEEWKVEPSEDEVNR